MLAVENMLRGFDGRLLLTGDSLGAALASNALRDLSDLAPVNYVAPIGAASSGSRPTAP